MSIVKEGAKRKHEEEEKKKIYSCNRIATPIQPAVHLGSWSFLTVQKRAGIPAEVSQNSFSLFCVASSRAKERGAMGQAGSFFRKESPTE